MRSHQGPFATAPRHHPGTQRFSTTTKGKKAMNGPRSAIQQLRARLKRLRALVRDEDHDHWYETHVDKKDKLPNLMGPGFQNGG